MWRRSDAYSVQNGNIKNSFSSVHLRRRVDGQFVQFSSRHDVEVTPFSSFSSVQSVQFTNCSGPGSDYLNNVPDNGSLTGYSAMLRYKNKNLNAEISTNMTVCHG